jgi:hypothetical protein
VSSSIYPNRRILIENLLAIKASQNNDLSIATMTHFYIFAIKLLKFDKFTLAVSEFDKFYANFIDLQMYFGGLLWNITKLHLDSAETDLAELSFSKPREI